VSSAPLQAGERVLLIDNKDRRYLLRLAEGGSFQTHAGILDHDSVIGQEAGSEIAARAREGSTTEPRRFLVLRPTLSDVILKMPRGAQVIYPKDLGAILIAADLYPGARVFETGVGSGALSIAALRMGCDVLGYELRGDFAARARSNVEALLGPEASYRVEERDSYEGIDETGIDRVLLDLPEPWRVVSHAAEALIPGGVLCAYLPSINQTAQLRAELGRVGFVLAETLEVLHRTWHIEGRSVRPDHRMVAHTGFITTARLGAPATRRAVGERRARRASADGPAPLVGPGFDLEGEAASEWTSDLGDLVGDLLEVSDEGELTRE
jgi:tRNA (adenine57-N1/adenine58-N1)-methyltransferase